MIRLALLSIAAVLAGCVPYPCTKTDRVRVTLEQHPLPVDSPEKIGIGDTVFTYTRKGRSDQYEVVELKEDGFIGQAWDKRSYRVLYQNQERMWVERRRRSLCIATIK